MNDCEKYRKLMVRLSPQLEQEIINFLASKKWKNMKGYFQSTDWNDSRVATQVAVIPETGKVYLLNRETIIQEFPFEQKMLALPIPHWLVAGCPTCGLQGEILTTVCLQSEFADLVGQLQLMA